MLLKKIYVHKYISFYSRKCLICSRIWSTETCTYTHLRKIFISGTWKSKSYFRWAQISILQNCYPTHSLYYLCNCKVRVGWCSARPTTIRGHLHYSTRSSNSYEQQTKLTLGHRVVNGGPARGHVPQIFN